MTNHPHIFGIGDNDGGVLINTDPKAKSLILHGNQRAGKSTADKEVLINEPLTVQKA